MHRYIKRLHAPQWPSVGTNGSIFLDSKHQKEARHSWHPRVSRAEDAVSSAALSLFAAQVEQCHPRIDGYITGVANLELHTILLPSSLPFRNASRRFVCQHCNDFSSPGTNRFLKGSKVPSLSLRGIVTRWRRADGAESGQTGIVFLFFFQNLEAHKQNNQKAASLRPREDPMLAALAAPHSRILRAEARRRGCQRRSNEIAAEGQQKKEEKKKEKQIASGDFPAATK